MLAASLLSLAYALDLGDPDGTALLAEDVSRRHDFGLGIRDGDVRQRAAWALPRQEVIPGVPWHVTGSLVGLDIALAPLALRRVSAEGVLEAPRLTSTERDAFAVSGRGLKEGRKKKQGVVWSDSVAVPMIALPAGLICTG